MEIRVLGIARAFVNMLWYGPGLRFVIFAVDSRCWSLTGIGAIALTRHGQVVFDLQVAVDEHNFPIRNTGDSKSSAEQIAALHVQYFFARLVLQDCRVDVMWRADNSDVGIVGHGRSSDSDRRRVGIQLAISGSQHNLPAARIRDYRSRYSGGDLLGTNVTGWQLL